MSKNLSPRPKSSAGRDSEPVPDGLNGYLRVARSLVHRFYRHQLPTREDCEQAAALAALEALHQLGPDGSLKQVTSAIRFVLYRQAKAYGYKMMNTPRADGKRTAAWTNREVSFSSLPCGWQLQLGFEPQGCQTEKGRITQC